MKFKHLFTHLFIALLVTAAVGGARAQTTVNLSPMAYGSVENTGTQFPNDLTNIAINIRSGWFKFDLTPLAGATIVSANLTYPTLPGQSNSGATANQLNCITVDIAALTGVTQYNQCAVSAGTTNLFTGLWSGSHPLLLQTNGPDGGNATTAAALATYLDNQLTNSSTFAAFSLVRNGTLGYSFQLPQLTVTYTGGATCGSTVAAGTAVSSAANVCPVQNYVLSLSGATIAGGLTYQWQSSPLSAGTWTNVPGATDVSYTATMSGSLDYQCIVTCTASSAADTSTIVTVTQNSFLNCFCPSNGLYNTDYDIFNVNIGSLNNISTCTTTGGAGSSQGTYANYKGLTPTDLGIGATMPFSVQVGTCGTTNLDTWTKIYIDYNQDGILDISTEEAYTSPTFTNGPHIEAGSITIPGGATPGQTLMRVIMVQTNTTTGIDPCLIYQYGETEDYIVNLLTFPNCVNPVVAGTVSTNKATVCTGQSFTVSATGYSASAMGITYQWEESPAGAGTWTPIAGATNTNYSATQTTDNDYRFTVTCAFSSTSVSSAPVSVLMAGFYSCYCSPLTGTTLHTCCGNYISYVGVPGTTLSTPSNTAGPGYYTYYDTSIPSQTGDLFQGVPYTLRVGLVNAGSTANVWIDYDQSGTFDASEQLANAGTTANYPDTLSIPLLIPFTALSGYTGMRIRHSYTPILPGTAACAPQGSLSTYETEDYVIEIITPPACAGMPATTVATGPSVACPGQNIALNATGYSIGTGITYQWEESPAGAGSWSQINNATAPGFSAPYSAATDYRFTTNCSNSGNTSYSNIIAVQSDSFFLCYCSPRTGSTLGTCCNSPYITNVTIVGTTLSNPNFTSNNNFYTQYLPNVPSQTASLAQGVTYQLDVDITYAGNGYGAVAWIDYDQNGTFDASEYVNLGIGTSSSIVSGSISVPPSAVLGSTGMRIRHYWSAIPAANACSNSSGYETEDYVVTIAPAPSCPPPSALTVGNLTTTSADLSWTSAAAQWEVEYGLGTSFTLGSGIRAVVSTNPYPVSGLTPGMQHSFFVRDICGPGDTSFWSARSVFYPLPPNDDCFNATDISDEQLHAGYVSSATQSDPACDASTTLANDVWYTFTTSATATVARVNANTSLTGTDLVMQIYDGACGALNLLTPTATSGGTTCIDGPGAGLEYGTIAVTPSTTYYVRVYGYQTSQGAFDIQLVIPPINDNICGAIDLVLNDPVPAMTNSTGATTGTDDPNPYPNGCSGFNNTIWYKFTPSVGGVYYVEASTPAASTIPMSIWMVSFTATGTCPGALTLTVDGGIGQTACQGSPYPGIAGNITNFTTTSLVAGTTYYFWIDGNSSSFGEIGIRVMNTLAIKLDKISAANVGTSNRVDWNTLSEERTDKFELQRSTDGKNFTAITELVANGKPSRYTYMDNAPAQGYNYYRLLMTEVNGSKSYSDVVKVFVKAGSFTVEAFPNPVSKDLTVRVSGIQGGSATVQITDVTGKIVKTITMIGSEETINMSGLANGIYLVKYADANHTQTIRVNKQ